MDLKKYSKYLSKELYHIINDIEKGLGIEVKELPPKQIVPIGARYIIEEAGIKKEYIKLSDGEYHLLGGGNAVKEIELRKTDTYIQWRYKDDEEWIDLIAIEDLRGEQGLQGEQGAAGREIQLRVDSGYIQWKYDTDITWNNLIALNDLRGADGQSIHHVSFTSTTALSGLPNEPGETDTYAVYGDAGETINLGTFTVYNGADGSGGSSNVLTFGKLYDDSPIIELSPIAWWDCMYETPFLIDKSGNNNNLIKDPSVSLFPMLSYEVRNGAVFPFIKFDNTSKMLRVDSSLYSQFSGSNKPLTLFYVYRPYSLPSGNTALFSIRGSTTTPLMNFYGNAGTNHNTIFCLRRDDSGTSVTANGITILQPGYLYLVTWVFNGTQIYARLNGQSEISLMNFNVGSITFNAIIMSGFVSSQYLDCGLYEVILFNYALSLSDVQTVESILMTKWDF